MALEIDPQGDEIVMFRSWTTVTLLISRGGFGPDRISAIDAFIRDMRFDYIHAPFDFTPNIFSVFDEPVYYGGTHAILNDPDTFYEGYLFDVSPVHDDRPFYFNFFRIDKAHELYGLLGESWMPFTDPGFILIFLLAQAAILSLAFLIFPIWFIKGGITEFKSIFFFFFIGLAYLFVELVFIQKFVLLMENIAYSASVVISAMLFFSGLGSYFSKNLKSRHVKMVCGLLFIIIAFYAEIVPHFVEGILGQSLIVRGILAAVFLAPLAFLMGMPFPTIIRSIDGRMVAWAWAVNGSASVLSAVLAILLGIIMGYNAVLILAAVLYLLSVMFV